MLFVTMLNGFNQKIDIRQRKRSEVAKLLVSEIGTLNTEIFSEHNKKLAQYRN